MRALASSPPALLLTHAFGKRYDLPIPLPLFIAGGAIVVVVSFLLVVPRGNGPAGQQPTSAEDDYARIPSRRHPAWGALGTAWLIFLVWCGYVGSQELPENIIVEWTWLYLWIAIPLSCAILGDWTRPVNPYLFLGRVANSGRLRRSLLGGEAPLTWPRWLGWWPAAILFFLMACCELIFNLTATVPHFTASILAGYGGFSLVMGFLFGDAWLARGEMFTVLFDTWGRLGFLRFGRPGRRGIGGGLESGFAAQPSRVAFVLLMLLNVNFDGLLSTPQWQNVLRQLPSGYNQLQSTKQHYFDVAAFLLMAVTLAIILGMFAQASATAGRHGSGPVRSLTGLLPSLVPIAFGYLFAHNLEYLLVQGQLILPLIGNPPGGSIWPISLPYPFNDHYELNHGFLPSGFYWYIALVVIIAVHVYAVVLAHRHLVRIGASRQLELRSEYPWLAAMVGYTCLSLWLLAQPLTKETATTSGLPAGHLLRPAASATAPPGPG